MYKRQLLYILASLFIISSCSDDDNNENLVQGFQVINLVGKAIGTTKMVPDIDGDGQDDLGNCFDLTIEDPYSGEIIGTGTDCLSNVTQVGDGLAIVGTAFFDFNDGSSVITRGLTSVRPKSHGSPDITHITGAIPISSSNDILSGTGQFEGARGGVRLSGAVNMSKVQSDNEITFNCLFVLPAMIDPSNSDPNKMVLRLVGTDEGEMRSVGDIDGDGVDDMGNCFDLDLIDVRTGEVIGTATDCLSNVNTAGEGLALTGTAIFNLPQGQIITRGLTSVQPKTHGSEDKTHITGAIPSFGDNDIVSGTGIYEGATGTSRLSGAVDMSRVQSNNEISFDCVFVLNID